MPILGVEIKIWKFERTSRLVAETYASILPDGADIPAAEVLAEGLGAAKHSAHDLHLGRVPAADVLVEFIGE